MNYFQKAERFATKLSQDGHKAHEASGPAAKVAGRTLAILAAPTGAVIGAGIGSLDRVFSSFETKSKSTMTRTGPRQWLIESEGSNLLKTARFFALPAGLGAAAAGVYNAYALLVSGGGLWSLSGAAMIGFLAAGVAWAAKTVAGGAWAGGKIGLKGGIGAASIGAHKVETLLKGEPKTLPATAQKKPAATMITVRLPQRAE